jgi:hypothetical protein
MTSENDTISNIIYGPPSSNLQELSRGGVFYDAGQGLSSGIQYVDEPRSSSSSSSSSSLSFRDQMFAPQTTNNDLLAWVSSPEYDYIVNTIPNRRILQQPSHKGSRVPKCTADDVKNLMDLVVRKQRGIGYDKKLTTQAGAQKFIQQRKLQNKLRAVVGDLDNDPITPDNVLLIDNYNIPKYIDGYSITSGQRRLNTLAVKPVDKARLRAFEDNVDKRLYKKWLRKYLSEAERRAHPYQEWKAEMTVKKPNFGQISNYSRFYKVISDKLKGIIRAKGLEVRQFNYIGLLASVVSTILNNYKVTIELPEGQKLEADDYELLSQIDLRGLPRLNNLLSRFAKAVSRDAFNDDYSGFRILPENAVLRKRQPVVKKQRKTKEKEIVEVQPIREEKIRRVGKRRVIIHDDDDDSENKEEYDQFVSSLGGEDV